MEDGNRFANGILTSHSRGHRGRFDDIRRLVNRTSRCSIPYVFSTVVDRLTVKNPLFDGFEEVYWRVMPKIVRFLHRGQYRKWNAPLDPFEPIWVDPNRIVRTTGRDYPAWNYRRLAIGAVRDGNWDQQVADIPDNSLSISPVIDDSVYFRSFENHFGNGVPWEETKLYREFESDDSKDTDAKLARYDWLAEQIREGYHSQRELLEAGKFENEGYYDIVVDEICVDIARDGELLFVDGRHRLAIAKAIGIEKVPVIVNYRHTEWMDYRDRVYSGEVEDDHPDVPTRERDR